MGYYSDYTSVDITDQVGWISSDPEVLSYDGSGVFSATIPGDVIITASLDGITNNSVNVHVELHLVTKLFLLCLFVCLRYYLEILTFVRISGLAFNSLSLSF